MPYDKEPRPAHETMLLDAGELEELAGKAKSEKQLRCQSVKRMIAGNADTAGKAAAGVLGGVGAVAAMAAAAALGHKERVARAALELARSGKLKELERLRELESLGELKDPGELRRLEELERLKELGELDELKDRVASRYAEVRTVVS